MKLPPYLAAGDTLRAPWVRLLVDYLRAITPQPSPRMRVRTVSGGTTFEPVGRAGGGGSFPPADLLFGYALDGTTCTLLAGRLHHGRRGPITTPQTDVALANIGVNYVGLAYADGSVSIPTAATSDEPYPDATTFRTWFWQFTVTEDDEGNKTALRTAIGHVGLVTIPSMYA